MNKCLLSEIPILLLVLLLTLARRSVAVSVVLDPRYRQRTIIIALTLICTVGFVIIISYLALRLYLGSKQQDLEYEATLPLDPPPSLTFQLDDLKLSTVVSRGRFGEVWKGTLNDLDIVAKVHREYKRGLKTFFI